MKQFGRGDYGSKQWELTLWNEKREKLFRHVCSESQLWQSFFLGMGKKLAKLARTRKKPQELTYGLWPSMSLIEESSHLLPDCSSRLQRDSRMSASLLPLEETRLFLVVWDRECVLYAACHRPRDGLLASLTTKVDELTRTQDLDISEMSQLYYSLRVIEKPAILFPQPEHLITFDKLPGWSKEHSEKLRAKTKKVFDL